MEITQLLFILLKGFNKTFRLLKHPLSELWRFAHILTGQNVLRVNILVNRMYNYRQRLKKMYVSKIKHTAFNDNFSQNGAIFNLQSTISTITDI